MNIIFMVSMLMEKTYDGRVSDRRIMPLMNTFGTYEQFVSGLGETSKFTGCDPLIQQQAAAGLI